VRSEKQQQEGVEHQQKRLIVGPPASSLHLFVACFTIKPSTIGLGQVLFLGSLACLGKNDKRSSDRNVKFFVG
jgi:hypothetical protein